MQQNIPTTFGEKYRIHELIGEGGFATVYRAVDTSLDREVAIKVLDPLLLRDRTFLDRFRREARTVAGLAHPNIVAIHEIGEHEGQHFIVMPYLPGPSLAQLIAQQGALDPDAALRIGQQVGAALDYAHQQGLVHRDVKPGNIILDGQGNAILTDFGIAKLVDQSVALTRTGTSLGTPQYMAPERWTTGHVDARTDLYALGIVLYQLLTGQVPFDGEASRVMYGHVHGVPPSPQSLNPSLPPAVEAVLLKALAKDPQQRYQTAGELLADLQAALAPRATEAMRRPAREAPAGEPKGPGAPVGRPLKWWWLGLLGVSAVLAATLVLKPLVAPRITRLAFVSDRDGNAEIYVLDRNGHATRLTQDPARDANPAWSPDKRRIVFCSDRDGDWEIYWVNADGTESGQVTDHPARDTQPAWHPNGSYIAFTSDRDGKRDIYVVGPDGIRRITSSPGDSESWDPAWAPDSTLLFTSDREGKREVHRINPSGEVVRVTHTRGDGESWAPAWAWSGGYVAFVSDRDGGSEAYAMAGDGSVSRVTQTPGGHGSWGPTVDPTRGYIAFASNRNGSLEVFTISNGDAVQLTHAPGDGRSWSPAW